MRRETVDRSVSLNLHTTLSDRGLVVARSSWPKRLRVLLTYRVDRSIERVPGEQSKGCKNDKAQCYQHRARHLYDGEFKMCTHLFSSWEIIMPQSVAISTGDVHVDGLALAVVMLA